MNWHTLYYLIDFICYFHFFLPCLSICNSDWVICIILSLSDNLIIFLYHLVCYSLLVDWVLSAATRVLLIPLGIVQALHSQSHQWSKSPEIMQPLGISSDLSPASMCGPPLALEGIQRHSYACCEHSKNEDAMMEPCPLFGEYFSNDRPRMLHLQPHSSPSGCLCPANSNLFSSLSSEARVSVP